MKKLYFVLLMLFLCLAGFSQESSGIKSKEIHVIGVLNLHTEGEQEFATVFDERTREVYKFEIDNSCDKLVAKKGYEFRLLGTCNGLECENVNYQMVEYSLSAKQTNQDLKSLRKGTSVKFN